MQSVWVGKNYQLIIIAVIEMQTMNGNRNISVYRQYVKPEKEKKGISPWLIALIFMIILVILVGAAVLFVYWKFQIK